MKNTLEFQSSSDVSHNWTYNGQQFTVYPNQISDYWLKNLTQPERVKKQVGFFFMRYNEDFPPAEVSKLIIEKYPHCRPAMFNSDFTEVIPQY